MKYVPSFKPEDFVGVDDDDPKKPSESDSFSSMHLILTQIDYAKKNHPENLMAKHFSRDWYETLRPELQQKLLQICKSGAENPESTVGIYAMHSSDYDIFEPIFEKVICDYHKIQAPVLHVTNWDLTKQHKRLREIGCPDGILDLANLGLSETSIRLRIGRNLAKFPLPGAMSREQRIKVENTLLKAIKKLIGDKSFGGNYYSLTPGSPHQISDREYQKKVKERIMFKDMDDDKYLNSAGIAAHWPYGRGCYVSRDKELTVWIGEEDHLRIICTKRGTILNEVFEKLRRASEIVEKYSDQFSKSECYGFVTADPRSLGSGMRASVHLKLPKLTSGDAEKLKAACNPLGLSVFGDKGEHSPFGSDGTVDVSPAARVMIEESAMLCDLYQGIKLLLKAEARSKFTPVTKALDRRRNAKAAQIPMSKFIALSTIFGLLTVGSLWYLKNKS